MKDKCTLKIGNSQSLECNGFTIWESENFTFGENDHCVGFSIPPFKELAGKEFKIEFNMSKEDGDWVLKTVFYDELSFWGKTWYNVCKFFRKVF